MDFDFSPEQKQMQEEARRFLSGRCGTRAARAALEGEPFDRGLWAQMSELGWTAIGIADEYGGIGLGALELCLVAEELGRVVAPVPFSSSIYLAADAIQRYGSAAQKERWLPALASGRSVATLAVDEPGRALPSQPFAVGVAAGRLSGCKSPVVDGAIADLAVVAAGEGGVASLFLVDLSEPSVRRAALRTVDPSRNTAALEFHEAPAERLEAAVGQDAVRSVICRAAIPFAFEQLGGADACLEAAVAFVRERSTFGRAVASYQAVKHRLADMYVKNQVARSNSYFGAWALSASGRDVPMAACIARLSAMEAFHFASREGLHLHGGMGFTWEADCHLFYRRAKFLALQLGPDRVWKERLMALHASPKAA
jgi:alkylation response protein AidB-like acyl-CoA dehydrogenase